MAGEKQTERREQSPEERLSLEGRRLLRVTGVKEVLRFEESAVVLRTGDRLLLVRGEGLSLRRLSPDEGCVELRGRIDALSYEQGGDRRSLLRRLFG